MQWKYDERNKEETGRTKNEKRVDENNRRGMKGKKRRKKEK